MITKQEISGAHTNIYFEGFNFTEEYLDTETINELNSVYKEYKQNILNTCQMIYLNAILNAGQNHPMHPHILTPLVLKEARNIELSLTGSEEFLVSVTVLTEIDRSFTFKDWKRVHYDIYQKSIKAHQSGITASEYLSRMFHSTTFEKPLKLFKNQNPQAVVDEVEIFVLSLSLGLRRPIALDDISIRPRYWIQTPSYPFVFPRMWGHYQGTTREASSTKFWAQTRISNSFMKPENVQDMRSCEDWKNILSSSPGAKYPLNTILRGVWQIFASSNSPFYLSKSQCISGITDILHGMEGLTRRSSLSEDNQYRIKFQKSWKKIIEGHSPYRPKTLSANNLCGKLYSLRNVIAHGGIESLDENLKKVKIALGDSWNPNDFSSQSTAFELATWVMHTLQSFKENSNLLGEFYADKTSQRKFSLKKIWNNLVYKIILD